MSSLHEHEQQEDIDPSLQAPTLNSISSSLNPLNEFAQQVLGREAAEDAENLLDFGRGHSILGEEQSFGELLQAERRRVEGEERDGEMNEERGMDEHVQEDEDGHGHHQEGDIQYDQLAIDQPLDISEQPRARSRVKRKRLEDGLDDNGTVVDPDMYAKTKKDSHKEVERKRRETIAAGIDEIAVLLPAGPQKEGKGSILKRAAQHITETAAKLAQIESEKEQLHTDFDHLEARWNDERARSVALEASWRQAEDLAASTIFELDRVKAELQALQGEKENVGKEVESAQEATGAGEGTEDV